MKVLKKDFKEGSVKLEVNNLDDIWHLSHIISKGDKVRSKDTRKIKVTDTKVVKKPVVVLIEVEKIEFQKHASILRISGPVIEAPEEIPKGSYHSFSIEEGSVLDIYKEKFMEFEKHHIEEAAKNKTSNVLIVALDREEAGFALLKKYGYEYLGDITGEVEKKYKEQKGKGDFYSDVIKEIEEHVKRYNITTVVVGSPAFWKDELIKKMSTSLRKIAVLATCSSAGKSGIDELLKRDEVRKVLLEERVANEIGLVEDLFKEISKGDLAVYGFKKVVEAVNSAAVKILIVTDDFLYSKRDELDSLMREVEKSKGSVHVISSDHEGGKRLKGLGGIGGILRFRI